MKLVKLLALSTVVLSSAALAQPTYLECDFKQSNGQPWVVQFSANESEGLVTATMPSGSSTRYRAAFTPNEVRFSDRDISYSINRVDLTVVRVVSMLKRRDEATCRIVETPARAF